MTYGCFSDNCYIYSDYWTHCSSGFSDQIVAERIRASCVRRSVTLGEGRGLTVSLGVSLFHPGDTPKSLIQRADEALSRAKLLGCNRVELQD